MTAGNLNPLNMQAWAIESTPHRSDGALEAVSVSFDSIGGLNCAFAIKWVWDTCFSVVHGFELEDFEDDAVNEIIGSANGGAGMWNQDSGNGQTWQQLMDSPDGQLAVNAQFAAVIATLSVHDIEVATDGAEFHGIILAAIQSEHDAYVTPMVDPGPPPGRKTPAELWPPIQKGLIADAEAVVAAQCSRLTWLSGGVIGAVPIP